MRVSKHIAAKVFGLIVLLGASTALAQNPTPQRPTHDRSGAEKRFHERRAYPLRSIPPGARVKALKWLDEMLAGEAAEDEKEKGKDKRKDNQKLDKDARWKPIGPRAILGGGRGMVSGRVSALVVDPRDPDVVYLGGAQGGVWKTMDGGAHWTALFDNENSLVIGSIALDPQDPDTVYVGTGEQTGDFLVGEYGAGIFKSKDGGASWKQLGRKVFVGPYSSFFFEGGARIGGIAVQPGNSQVLLAAATLQFFDNPQLSGIFRSEDGGTRWTLVLGVGPANQVLFDPINGNIAYAAIGGSLDLGNPAQGIYKSTDGGETWFKLTGTGANLLPTVNVGRTSLVIAPSQPSTLYASIAGFLFFPEFRLSGRLYKTTDGGQNWTRLRVGRYDSAGRLLGFEEDYCGFQCPYDNAVAVDPKDANVVFVAGQSDVFRSLDGGATWAGVPTEELHVDHHALAFSSDGSRVYDGNDGGVWSAANPRAERAFLSWSNLNATLSLTQFYPGLSLSPNDVNVSLGGTQDNGVLRYSGNAVWTEVINGDGGWTGINQQDPDLAYAMQFGIGNEIFRSIDGGNHFVPISTGIDPFVDGIFQNIGLGLDPSDGRRIYGGGFRVYQSVDAGDHWTAISPAFFGTANIVGSIAVAPGDSNTVYVYYPAGTTTEDSPLPSRNAFLVTRNALSGSAATWTELPGAGLPPDRFVNTITVDPRTPTKIYLAFSGFSFGTDTMGHVFRTSDDGVGWVDITSNLPNAPVYAIEIDPELPDTLYAATDVGVFVTYDGGKKWRTMGKGLPRLTIVDVKLHQATRTLRAATHGRGMWDLVLTQKK